MDNKENNVPKEKSELMKVINELSKGDVLRTLEMYKYVRSFLPQDKEEGNIEKLKILSKYDDIATEFFKIIGYAKPIPTSKGSRLGPLKITRTDKSVSVNGYTAYDIMEKEPCLLPDTAYIWLSRLRDNDENSKDILNMIENGIPANRMVKLSYNIGQIRKYLSKLEGTTDVVVEKLVKPYYGHPDIANEFEYWIRTKTFVSNNPITEQGYTAQRIYNEFGDRLQASGIFSLLITLRTNPEKGLNYIKTNFPIK